MKHFLLSALTVTTGLSCLGQGPAKLLPNYNDTFYSSVLSAAMGVGGPFLLEQQYLTMPGVTVHDSTLTYNGITYPTHEEYVNPVRADTLEYYLPASKYAEYGISSFLSVWPYKAPNAFFHSDGNKFISEIDCVGYGTRLLSATGDNTEENNAYLNLQGLMHTPPKPVPFAAKGFVAMAYQFAVAFPTLPGTLGPGWRYIAGNVNRDSIVWYNAKLSKGSITKYNGVAKGQFNLAMPGDILAFGYGPGPGDNGHFMVIEQRPTLLDTTTLRAYCTRQTTKSLKNLVDSFNVYAVPLYDCSQINIHFDDSRRPILKTKTQPMSGIGHGTLIILASKDNDTPLGFVFGPAMVKNPGFISRKLVGVGGVFAISVGRFTPPNAQKKAMESSKNN